MDYKIGDTVLFNWNSSFFTKLITKYNLMNYGESRCTHAGKIIEDLGDQVIIAEPTNLKDRFCCYVYDKWWLDLKVDAGIIHIARPNIKLSNVGETYLKYEGTKYGILDIISICLFWAFGIKIDITGSSSIICSEGCVRIDYDCSNGTIDLEKEYNKPYSLITPMDIFNSKYYTIYGKKI